MTPTDEETELAAAIFVSEGFEDDEELEAADIALRMSGARRGFVDAPDVGGRYCLQARAILAAGYRKQDPATIRNQALEAAAKSCDALVHEASANRAAESTNYDFWQGAAVGAEESAARIRALKT